MIKKKSKSILVCFPFKLLPIYLFPFLEVFQIAVCSHGLPFIFVLILVLISDFHVIPLKS